MDRAYSMSPLQDALSDYLEVRRALGYKLTIHGRLLPQFVAYLHERGAQTITTEHALAWATSPPRSMWTKRLSIARGFARYMKSLDPATEVPPNRILRAPSDRVAPYVYSAQQIAALLKAATQLYPAQRADTYQTLLGLLAATGMRVGEALALDRQDIDFQHGLLTIHSGKFSKSRVLPLHPSTVEALRSYLYRRDQEQRSPPTAALLAGKAGTARLRYQSVRITFQQLVAQADIQPQSARSRPRLHDLRHTFAVRTVIDSYQTDGDLNARLALLCAYLGHADPISTYWYLTGTPELLALAAQRLERHLADAR
jgi:integrase/recombinase XerD